MINFIQIYKTVNKNPEFITKRNCAIDYSDEMQDGTYTWYEYNNVDMPRFADGIKSITTCAPSIAKTHNNRKYNIVHNRPSKVEKMNTLERCIAQQILAYAYKKYWQRYL